MLAVNGAETGTTCPKTAAAGISSDKAVAALLTVSVPVAMAAR